ncbi:MAG: hypothetical protein JXX14_23595 [Deltaproteobacteria bacterium]|nr:hypothetical protein [Deltaproteobacteria bacterium]
MRINRRLLPAWLIGAMGALMMVHCTDSKLYGKGNINPAADRLAVTGRVCTDDPQGAGFPVRVVLIVDQANGPIFSDYDPEQLRIRALNESLSIHESNVAFSFAVIGMGPIPRLYAPQEGYFTRNTGELSAAISSLTLPQGCVNELCRNYEDSLFTAGSLIEGDMAEMNAGERSRTQYVVILMTGGDPQPLLQSDWGETITSLQSTVNTLKEKVEKGASAFSFHTLHLAPRDSSDETETLLRELAFAGNGKYERFNSADAITLDHIGLLKLSALFEAKKLVVTNVNALPGMDGARLDSDGDGLPDDLERELQTNPLQVDSDGDGVGDLVEKLTLFNPRLPDPKPAECEVVEGPPYSDIDSDRLNDCEELLVGTDMSLTDSDGDGITDWMELVFGTDYLYYDYGDDADWDGSTNGDEARFHTDPRANDAIVHLGNAYRYEEKDLGIQTEYVVAEPGRVLGVEILEAGADTNGGVATLRFTPDPPRLAWQDPQDGEIGPFVNVSEGGEFVLYASSYRRPGTVVQETGTQLIDSDEYTVLTGDSDITSEGVARWVQVYVTTALLPNQRMDDYLLVQAAERHCIEFTVRNIQLVETKGSAGNNGLNNVFIYFSQAPAGDLMLPGLYRVAHIPVVYTVENGRDPKGAVLEISDADFMTVGL